MKIILNIVFLVALSVNATAQTVDTYAGTGTAGSSGDGGLAVGAYLNKPYGIACDDSGNLYIADQLNEVIRKVDVNTKKISSFSSQINGLINPVLIEYSNSKLYVVDEPGGVTNSILYVYDIASSSLLTTIYLLETTYSGIAVKNDTVYLTVSSTHTIKQVINVYINPIEIIFAGTSGSSGNIDGPITSSIFTSPLDICFDNVGNLLIAQSNGIIRKIDLTLFEVSTIINSGLTFPEGITCGNNGDIYIADQGAKQIKLFSNGNLSTFAGDGSDGCNDGDLSNSRFKTPSRIVVDNDLTVYVSDVYCYKVKRITNCIPADSPSITNVPYNPDDCPSEIAFYVESTSDLNDNADWAWYGDACGQDYLFSGDTVFVNSQIAQSFYVRGENGCGLNGDCITFEFESLDCTPTQIDSNDQFKKLITTAFSPNKDGVNDVWVIDSIQPNTTVRIYNRWGDLVKKIDNYDNVEKVWDGTNFLNQKVHSGTYFYTIEKNNIKITSGWIEVVR